MDAILQSLLDDHRAGLHQDADGRRFFRQRRVRFETIEFEASDLLRSGWDRFTDRLAPPPRSGKDPDPAELRRYAAEASRRFLALWYRCIDVLVARSLFGRDRRIFRIPFFHGSLFMDTGVADDPVLSAVDPELHSQIIRDYNEGNQASPYHIFTLSSYLEGLTDDLREALAPLHAFWKKEEERSDTLSEIDQLSGILAERLRSGNPPVHAALLATVDRRCEEVLRGLMPQLREIPSQSMRQAIHQLRSGTLVFNMALRRETLGHAEKAEELLDALDLIELPSRIARTIRRVCFYESRKLHETLRLLRLNTQNTDRLDATVERLAGALSDLDTYVHEIEQKQFMPRLDSLCSPESESSRILRQLHQIPEKLKTVDDEIIELHRHWLGEGTTLPFEADPRYPTAQLPPLWNPVRDEAAVLSTAREILINRLKPVRQTANDYSLRPEHRHGILTLNPVLRLWKDRTVQEHDLPILCRRQINTIDVVSLLLDLICLVDSDFPQRELTGGRILLEKHGHRSLTNLRLLLVPGSCFPIREIAREDFPEYRNRIIGDRRKPDELGVLTDEEDGVLTGAWYRKATHTLYYPVGADNASLLRLIYTASRVETVPAFFFAAGQFVYDCLPDSLVYYRSGERTFREVIEDFYIFEERIRKNRDEKKGRRRRDNSRAAVRFLFAVNYSRYITEVLTASSQGSFRHPATEEWFSRHTGIPLLSRSDRSQIRSIREQARSLIETKGSRDSGSQA